MGSRRIDEASLENINLTDSSLSVWNTSRGTRTLQDHHQMIIIRYTNFNGLANMCY
ncbi:hypothetical protein COLO4_15280 [Corchorus olitorius]|uniref:Uncharacterized protein n=1 Tax=Corchorus olitorius TaxID=93759 RepID=A0A1R3JNK8_9ROSI|nr:hypothetical protein COLO4_15280 [Corchorus olitorius]